MLLNRQSHSSFGKKSIVHHHSHLSDLMGKSLMESWSTLDHSNLSPNFMVEPPQRNSKIFNSSKVMNVSNSCQDRFTHQNISSSGINPNAPAFDPSRSSLLRQSLWVTQKKPSAPPPPANVMYSEQRYKTVSVTWIAWWLRINDLNPCHESGIVSAIWRDRRVWVWREVSFCTRTPRTQTSQQSSPQVQDGEVSGSRISFIHFGITLSTNRCSSYHEYGFCSFGLRCSFIHEKQDPIQVIKNVVETHHSKKREMQVVAEAPCDIEPETGYTWGSGGRLPVFQKMSRSQSSGWLLFGPCHLSKIQCIELLLICV